MKPSEIADWLEAEAHKYPKDGIAFRDHMKKAATIRAQAEALKIAAEALEAARFTLSGAEQLPPEVVVLNASMARQIIVSALARMKEAGQ